MWPRTWLVKDTLGPEPERWEPISEEDVVSALCAVYITRREGTAGACAFSPKERARIRQRFISRAVREGISINGAGRLYRVKLERRKDPCLCRPSTKE